MYVCTLPPGSYCFPWFNLCLQLLFLNFKLNDKFKYCSERKRESCGTRLVCYRVVFLPLYLLCMSMCVHDNYIVSNLLHELLSCCPGQPSILSLLDDVIVM